MDIDLKGKNYLVTGVTSGIGLAVAQGLVQRGANLLGVGRSPGRCAETQRLLANLPGAGQVWVTVADLAQTSQVRSLAADISGRVTALHGLINNAGVFALQRSRTPEGVEQQWAVNHLAPFLLTQFLLPQLNSAAWARVVTVSSGSHYHTRLPRRLFATSLIYNGLQTYKHTKLANVLFTAEMNRILGPASSVHAFAADPGLVVTEMGFKDNPPLARWVWAWRRRGGIFATASAEGIIFLAVEPGLQSAQGIYWKHGRPQAPNPVGLDPQAARRLWQESVGLCAALEAASLSG